MAEKPVEKIKEKMRQKNKKKDNQTEIFSNYHCKMPSVVRSIMIS